MASDYSKHILWCHVREVKILENCYKIHMQKSRLYANMISGFLCVTSVSGVASFFSDLPAWIWGAIVFITSILSAINHLFPYNKRADKIALILPEFDTLVNSVLHTWDSEEHMSDQEISDAIYKFRNERARLESKYLSGDIPERRSIVEQAQEQADNYLKYTLSFDCEEIEDAKAKSKAN